MLEFFRNNIGGLLGGIIVGVLAFAFAFSFGTQSKGWGEGQSEQFAAKVSGNEISDAVFQQVYNLQGGRNYGQNTPEATRLKAETLNGLIERELLIELADDLGITASKDEAEDRIIDSAVSASRSLSSIAQQFESNSFLDPGIFARALVVDGHRIGQSFRDDNDKFDLESYQKFVRYYLKTTEENFVEQQRREIIAERMRQLIASSVRISAEEVRQGYNRENDTAEVAYIRLIPAYYAQMLDPTDAELKQWAVANKDAVEQHYETNKFRYTNLDKMASARHILAKVDKEASEEDRQAVRVRMDKLLKKIQSGADFAAMAQKHSEDEKTAAGGGDLGFLKRGQMVAEFDTALFALEPGAVSEVVETKDGLHIIKLEAFREGDVSLEEATPEIAEKLYRTQKGQAAAKTKGEELLARLKGGANIDTLLPETDSDGATSAIVPKVLTSRSFTRFAKSIPGVGEAPQMVAAAFQLTAEGEVLPDLYDVRGDYFVATLAARKMPSDEEFAGLKDALTASLLSQKQGFWLLSRVSDMKKQAEEQGDIEVLYTPPALPGQDRPMAIDLKPTTEKGGNTGSAPAPAGDKQK